MSITFTNRVYPAGYVGEDDGGPKGGVNATTGAANTFSLDTVSTNAVTVNGTVTNVGDPVTVTGLLPNTDGKDQTSPITLYVTQYDTSGYIQFSDTAPPANGATPPSGYYSNAYRYVFSNSPLTAGQKVGGDNDPTLSEYQVTCFAGGTLIRTVRGDVEVDVAVEALRIGDLAATASGGLRPIRWIGSRRMDPRRHPRPQEALPVRIVAHAFAENRPARDLRVSPGHAICVDLIGEVLIPAGLLVNGTTVVQEDVAEVTYWHVELDGHDVLLAEGLPAESYLEMGNRGFFAEAGVVALAASPDAAPNVAPWTHADFCRPFHAQGPVLDAVRAQLRRRAERMAREASPAMAAVA